MKNNAEIEKLAQQQRNEIDDYLGSIVGLYAFAESACWDESSRAKRKESQYSIPYKFKINEKEITPDSAIQLDSDYGIVSEMKKHFNESKPNQFEQLKKYDNDLEGWWTENKKIKTHDLVLLCHMFSSIGAVDNYKNWENEGNNFDRNFAIIEFSYMDSGQKQNFVLRRLYGQLTDKEHDEALRKTKIIPPQIVERLFGKYKFYDVDPPLFHVPILIFNYVLPLLVVQEEFEENSGRQKRIVKVDVDTVKRILQEQFLPLNHYLSLPKTKWVISALDFLVSISLGVRLDEKNYQLILQAPTRKDLCEYFSSKLISKQNSKQSVSTIQPDLFSN